MLNRDSSQLQIARRGLISSICCSVHGSTLQVCEYSSAGLSTGCCRVLGKNNENLGKIVAVIAKCLGKGKAGKDGLVDEATWQRMLVLLQQMNSSLPPQVPEHTIGYLCCSSTVACMQRTICCVICATIPSPAQAGPADDDA